MKALNTIEDLIWAQENTPDVVKSYLEKITVERDLIRFKEWCSENEITHRIRTILRRKRQRSWGIHPSSASKKGVCLLKLYNECVPGPAPHAEYDHNIELTWDIGTFLHDLHQHYFREMYEDQFRDEVFLHHDPYRIKSHTDGIFQFSDYRFILEMKSIKEGGSYGWETVQSKPMEDHIRQSHFYMWLSGVPFALILYICKNNSKYKEHAIAFNPALWEEIERDVILPVLKAVEEKKPPEGTPAWACRWCSFEYACPAKQAAKGQKTWVPWRS